MYNTPEKVKIWPAGDFGIAGKSYKRGDEIEVINKTLIDYLGHQPPAVQFLGMVAYEGSKSRAFTSNGSDWTEVKDEAAVKAHVGEDAKASAPAKKK